MKSIYLTLICYTLATSLWGQIIQGPTQVCEQECYTYRLQPIDAQANWQVTAPDGSNVPFTYSSDSSVIEICFPDVGIYELSSGSGTTPVSIFSGEFTDPVFELLSPTGCENPWLSGQNCVDVCYGQEVTLRPRDVVFDTLEWSVFGPAEIVNSSNAEITLRLDSVTGDVFIGYFGTSGDRCLTEGGRCLTLIAPPTAEIGSAEFGIIEDSIEVCQGQLVNFENASDAPALSWGLASGPSGDAERFRYRFATPGEYELTLSVGFDCSCTAEKTITVLVNPTPIPEIQCVSSVCAGDTALYETQAGCAPYQWRIEGNGTIVGGGGTNDPFMEVNWTGGNEGWVELEHDCADACPTPARERIQILGPDTQISGRIDVCPEQVYSYRVPARDGTQFNWSVQGGSIQGSSQSQSIQVIFDAFTSDPFVAVEMDDCTRGCLQRDTLWVNRTNPFTLEGPSALCFGEDGSWETRSSGTAVSSFWTLRGPDGAVVDSTSTASSDYSFSFSQAGRYTLETRPETDTYCLPSRETSVVVRPPLAGPGNILGADTICPGNAYWYEGEQATPSGTVREWIAIEGADTTFQNGNPIRQSWQAGLNRRLITFFRNVETGCLSEVSEIAIEEIGSISIEGPDTLCRGLEGVFYIREALSDEVEWTLNANSGARITDQMGLDSVRILFSEAGMVELTASVCGQTTTKEIFIARPAPIDLDALESIGCGLDVSTREVDGSLYDSIFWYENGALVSTSNRTELRRGQRNMLVVTDNFGCTNRTAFTIPFADFVRPRITSLNSPIFCNGGQATLVHDVADTTDLNLAWYRDSSLIAENVDSVLINTTGYYRLEVTQRSTGCVIESDLLLVCESCDPDPDSTVVVCPLIGGGSPNEGQSCDPSLGNLITNVNYVDGKCDQIQLTTIAPDMVRGTAVWRVDLESGPRLYFGDTISFQATQNGQFTVYNSAFGINSMGDTTIYCPYPTIVEVPGTLDATSSLACLGDSTVFNPNIELIASASITNVQWNFGDGVPGSGSSEIMPSFRYAAADSFSATIEIETSASCSLFDTLDVVVFPNPDAAWAGDSTACTNERYEVEALGTAEFYDWRFGNPLPDSAQAIGATTGYRYDSAGTYDIELTVEDLLGCTQDSVQTVQFNAYSGADSIIVQPDLPACLGDWVDLSVSGSFSNLLWSTGSTDAQITADRPGPYAVEVTDNNGCQSELGPIDIEYEPAPDVHIRANALQGGGRYSGDTLEVCFGQAVEIRLLSSPEDYTLNWSVGGNAPVIRYDGSTAPILNEGFYAFELTATDTTTNCTASDEVFVVVHPQPEAPVVTTSQSQPYCAGDMIELRVDNPQGNVNYKWNTGETGESIIANAAQPYSVRAINDFGCEAESASLIVHPLPDLSFFPLGCYEECGGTEICLPMAEGSRLVEWYRNGEAEDIPSDLSQVRIDSSGQYTGLVENAFGCEQQTDSIRFDIFYDAGIVSGFVFLDRNGDNVFNTGDSLVPNLTVHLYDNMTFLDSTQTDSVGDYAFTDVPLGDYRVEIDSSQLPVGWTIVRGVDSVQLTDCGEEVIIPAFILQDCPATIDSMDLTACTGDSLLIEGTYYTTDTLFEIVQFIDGCPEATVYDLQFFPGGDTTSIEQIGCEGDTLDVMGQSFVSDTLLFQTLTNTFGCDSTVSIQLTFEAEPTVDTLITLCFGDSVQVQGNWYDQDTSFSYLGQLPGISCDVRFEVEIQIQPNWNVTHTVEESCPSSADGSIQFSLGNRTLSGLRRVELDGIDSLQLQWNNLAAGDYALMMEDTAGCVYSESIILTGGTPLDIAVPEVAISCEGEAVQLSAQYISGDSTGLSLNWVDGGTGPNLTVTQPGDYVLRVMTDCEDFEVTGRVRVDGANGGIRMFVPNVFSPNRDGINDVFQPTFSKPGAIETYRLQIFDRWGNLMFESQDPAVGWDGQFREKVLNPGVYVWRIEWMSSACAGSTIVEESGSISLLR